MATGKTVKDWIQAASDGATSAAGEDIKNEISKSLESGSLKFSDFIGDVARNTGTGQDLTIVGRVLELLPQVLSALQNQPTRHDIHFVTEYLCGRLDLAEVDPTFRSGIASVARSLRTLCNWGRFPPSDSQVVAKAVFKFGASNNFSSQLASTREALYLLITDLFNTHSSPLLRDLSTRELVSGIVTMGELEKNPSCLRVLFKIYASISKNWELSTDDFKLTFDSFVRYFPVSMKAAPAQPNVPTTEELRGLLLDCLVSNDGYADATFEAMKDRLDVDSANTKLEALKTIEQGVKSYSPDKISQVSQNLWDSLKFEVWNGENEDFIEPTLRILQEISKSVSPPVENVDDHSSLTKFVSIVATECNQRIRDGKRAYVVTSGRILKAVASSSPHSFALVSMQVIPTLDTLWQGASDGSERAQVLQNFNNILRARLAQPDIDSRLEKQTHTDTMAAKFLAYRERIVEIYSEDLQTLKSDPISEDNVQFGIQALEGLVNLFQIPDFFSEDKASEMINVLNKIFLDTTHQQDIHEKAVSALKQISASRSSLFQEILLPANISLLPEDLSVDQDIRKVQLVQIRSQLSELVQISTGVPSKKGQESDQGKPAVASSNFEAIELALCKQLRDVLQHPGQTQYANSILAAMVSGLEEFDKLSEGSGIKAEDSNSRISSYAQIVSQLFNIVVQPGSQNDGTGYVGLANIQGNVDDKFVELMGRFAMTALRSKAVTSENNFLTLWNANNGPESVIWSLFSSNSLQTLLAKSQPDLLSGTPEKSLANVLSMFLLAGSRPQDKAALGLDVRSTAIAMIRNSVATNLPASKLARMSALWMLQLLVNKFGATKEKVEDGAQNLVQLMEQVVKGAPGKSDEEAHNVYQTLAYFAAASLGSLDASVAPLINLMLEGVRTPKHGKQVAQSFRILLAPSDIISKENFCNLRLLRKARLYNLAAENLITLWRAKESSPETKENAILALTGIFAFLEEPMLQEHATEILPVVLKGANIHDDDWAKTSCIQTLLRLIPLASQQIEEHLGSIINRMTDRTHNTLTSPSDSSVRCRAMALEVIQALTIYLDARLLLKRKAALMKELDIALDDPSRDVRRKAEQCKMAWFNLAGSE